MRLTKITTLRGQDGGYRYDGTHAEQDGTPVDYKFVHEVVEGGRVLASCTVWVLMSDIFGPWCVNVTSAPCGPWTVDVPIEPASEWMSEIVGLDDEVERLPARWAFVQAEHRAWAPPHPK